VLSVSASDEYAVARLTPSIAINRCSPAHRVIGSRKGRLLNVVCVPRLRGADRHTPRRIASGVLAIVAAAATLGACTNAPDTSHAVGTKVSAPHAGATSKSDVAGRAAVSAYNAAFRAEVTALGGGNASAAHLGRFMASPMLDATMFVTKQFRTAGVVYRGTPTWQATVTAVDLASNPPGVTLSICVTTNGWSPVYSATGRPYPTPTGPSRELKIARLIKQQGRWLLVDEERQNRPC